MNNLIIIIILSGNKLVMVDIILSNLKQRWISTLDPDRNLWIAESAFAMLSNGFTRDLYNLVNHFAVLAF